MKKGRYAIMLFIVILIIIILSLILYFNHNKKVVENNFSWKNWYLIKTQQECESLGGRWSVWSFWQNGEKACDLPIPDGGKECIDGSECENNLCLYAGDGEPKEGDSGEGECARWVSTSCVNWHEFIQVGKVHIEECIE